MRQRMMVDRSHCGRGRGGNYIIPCGYGPTEMSVGCSDPYAPIGAPTPVAVAVEFTDGVPAGDLDSEEASEDANEARIAAWLARQE